MPFACPLPFTRRVDQASVNRHVLRLTELWHLPQPVRLVHSTSKPSRASSSAQSRASHRHHDSSSALGQSSFKASQPPSRAALPHRHSRAHTSRNRGYETRFRKPAASSKTVSLLGALLTAAERGVGPSLHFDAADISFTNSAAFDWAVAANKAYVSEYNSSSHHTRHGNEDDAVYVPGRRISIVQRVLAKTLIDMIDEPMRGPGRGTKSLLSAQGYNASDLHHWRTILTTPDSTHAARLLTGRAGPPLSLVDDHSTTPAFVYLYLLRRRHINPAALRILVAHLPAWHQDLAPYCVGRSHNDDDIDCDILGPTKVEEGEDEYTDPSSGAVQSDIFRACIRLFRHARLVWPESMPAIAQHLTSLMRMSSRAELALLEGDFPVDAVARLTKFFNRALYLISEPVAVEPFKSTTHQEAAQAVILRHMAEHVPPLVINREGYRAVTRVQLAQAKTPEESEWARLKSPSWPPWKEDRTGMDANISLDYGVSRARHVLNRMQEAGYPKQTWEHVALIYAGWDSDMSPTIQTRAAMPEDLPHRVACQIWAARIRSTQTVQQAWACFLSYEDARQPPDQDVYLAMFEKLVEERKRQRLHDAHPTHPANRIRKVYPVLPGDVKEVFPPPTSTHQATYTKTTPPTVQQLHDHMLHRGLIPSGRTLAFLIKNAEKMAEGLNYLQASDERYGYVIDSLINRAHETPGLEDVPDTVFAAIIGLLVRFPNSHLAKFGDNIPSQVGKHSFVGDEEVDLRQPLARAIYLLTTEKRPYLPTWNVVLRGLARHHSPVIWTHWNSVAARSKSALSRSTTEALDKMIGFNCAKYILDIMRHADLTLDVVGFRWFCTITENAALAACQILAQEEFKDVKSQALGQSLRRDNPIIKARTTRASASYVRNVFWALVGQPPSGDASDAPISGLPRLLVTPSPANLHAYIRALGLLQDYEGLQELVLWMTNYWPELEARKDMDRSGGPMLRRCIVALRVFLEGRWQDGFDSDNVETQDALALTNEDECGNHAHEENQAERMRSNVHIGAPRELLDQVWDEVDGVEGWGGWASEEEADTYVRRMKETRRQETSL